MKVLLRALALLASFATTAHAGALPALNQSVLGYAEDHLDQQVGNGQCWTLANEALKSAGAHQPCRGGYECYEYGTPVAEDEILPGDEIQFENARYEDPRGGWMEMAHHTAVVETVGENGVITMLHQNWNGHLTVAAAVLHRDRRVRGDVTYFRPQPR